MSDDVRHLWVLSLSASASIHQAMTDISGLTVKSSKQHVEMGMSRRNKDHTDCKIFIHWLRERNPFAYKDANLHSLSLGLTSYEDDGINCDNAEKDWRNDTNAVRQSSNSFMHHQAERPS